MTSAKCSIILIEFLVKSLVSEEWQERGCACFDAVGFVKGQIFLNVESVTTNYAQDHIEMYYAFSDIFVCGVVVERVFVFFGVELNFVFGILFCFLLRV